MRRAHAVLTGDLVKSRALTTHQLRDVRALTSQAASEILQQFPDAEGGALEFFRGDSWQLLLRDPRLFLRTAIYIKARLRTLHKNYRTRIAIGIGPVEFVDQHRVSLSHGEAFVRSGHALDELTGAGLRVALAPEWHQELGYLDPLAILCNAIAESWSERQAEMICLLLSQESPSQREIAERLQVTPQAVSKSLATSKFPAVSAAIDWVESEVTARGHGALAAA
jgi:hypothetical protein